MLWDRLRQVTFKLPLDNTTFLGLKLSQKPRDDLSAAYSTVFDSVSDGAVVLAPDNQVVLVNPAAAQIIESVVGSRVNVKPYQQSAPDLLSMWPGIGVYLNSTTKEHATSVQTDGRDGFRSFDIQIRPIIGEDETFEGRLLLIHETTEREQAAEALKQRKQQLRMMVERLQLIDRSRANEASHLSSELRHSLTQIDLHLNRLRNGLEDSWADSLNHIENEISRVYKQMEAMVDPAEKISPQTHGHSGTTDSVQPGTLSPTDQLLSYS